MVGVLVSLIAVIVGTGLIGEAELHIAGGVGAVGRRSSRGGYDCIG